MKKLTKASTTALIILTVSFFGCSKKMQTFQFGNQSIQPSTTNLPITQPTESAMASADNKSEMAAETNPAILVAKQATGATISAPKTIANEKPTLKQRIAQKIVAKKIQKLEKSGGLDDKMKLGIVIAAVSLLVLIIAATVLKGNIGELFTVLGALGLLTGLIIILLVALEVI